MKLLILTQAVDENNPVLGFFLDWIKELAKHCEGVIVICLYQGRHELPANIKVLSLGKEEGTSRLKYLFRFYKYIWQERKNYDAVFVHMSQIYVILGGWLWRSWNKKVGLWYAHGHVPFSLRVAEKITNIIFTSTVSGFRLPSSKVKVVGQGIDANKFTPAVGQKNGSRFKIITIGRISPTKDYETLISAIEKIVQDGKARNIEVNIIGEPGTPEQKEYLEKLKEIIAEKKLESTIYFLGAVANKNIIPRLQESDLFVNTSHTGSLDKAILEAMACGLPILSCNESLLEVLGDFKNRLMFEKKNTGDLVKKIKEIYELDSVARAEIGNAMRRIVVTDHSLSGLSVKILSFYQIEK